LVTAKFNTSIACGSLDEALALKLLRRSGPLLAERGRQLALNLAGWASGCRRRQSWTKRSRVCPPRCASP
jgi:hypothetical protein